MLSYRDKLNQKQLISNRRRFTILVIVWKSRHFLSLITLILSIVAWASAKSKLFCEIACGSHYVPVCATNGQTYDNRCFCDCRGATFAHNGVCKSDVQPNEEDSTTQAE
ncbi:unnamed protein product [Leptidea sinapis]|uniref:Kazal-like domain-containing protein n=1 Tax=Leptidea sinapis TaxID=189913 RepID=A0A5E4R2U4_9NEOP|nr:unnamed protein product [Leptidea sinapis]